MVSYQHNCPPFIHGRFQRRVFKDPACVERLPSFPFPVVSNGGVYNGEELAVQSAWPSPGLDACLGETTAIFKPNGPSSLSVPARAALAQQQAQRRSCRVGTAVAELA